MPAPRLGPPVLALPTAATSIKTASAILGEDMEQGSGKSGQEQMRTRSEWLKTTCSEFAALLTVHQFERRLSFRIEVEVGAARDLTKYLLNLPAAFRQKEVL